MNQIIALASSRRDFMKLSAAAAVATAVAATTSLPSFAMGLGQSAAQDMDILNYALTLEHLEAAAYKAVIASGLLSGNVLKLFQEFGGHEATHEGALTDTINKLGGKPVAALAKYNFPSFKSQSEIVTYFQGVEELGASAYLGQAPRLQNPDLLSAAVSIHNVEAQHASVLGDLIGVQPPVFGTAKTMEQVLAVVGPLLSTAAAPAASTTTTTTAPTAMPATGGGGAGVQDAIGALEVLLAGLGALGAGFYLRRGTRNSETHKN